MTVRGTTQIRVMSQPTDQSPVFSTCQSVWHLPTCGLHVYSVLSPTTQFLTPRFWSPCRGSAVGSISRTGNGCYSREHRLALLR
ncbi:hypothetical protein M404DRAFT_410433 [Pisolithus tinctorius Marx 270]|uniref:Uncharacterized protein n=1 Tax=Pisolithus tinctorius Marx 270 TaxID=870435 RepID=A0A0C3P342_PISTI|nr:hypothetical protein M404DRAFT_410433 [Pisolithus tinctorius Marx 270]